MTREQEVIVLNIIKDTNLTTSEEMVTLEELSRAWNAYKEKKEQEKSNYEIGKVNFDFSAVDCEYKRAIPVVSNFQLYAIHISQETLRIAMVRETPWLRVDLEYIQDDIGIYPKCINEYSQPSRLPRKVEFDHIDGIGRDGYVMMDFFDDNQDEIEKIYRHSQRENFGRIHTKEEPDFQIEVFFDEEVPRNMKKVKYHIAFSMEEGIKEIDVSDARGTRPSILNHQYINRTWAELKQGVKEKLYIPMKNLPKEMTEIVTQYRENKGEWEKEEWSKIKKPRKIQKPMIRTI